MKHIAFDLGASGGKMALGDFTGEALRLQPLHRFENRALPLRDGLYWDFWGIHQNLLRGIALAASAGHDVKSVGLDSFSNDFGFVDSGGSLLSQVRCYRDPRTQRHAEAIYSKLSPEQLHRLTGNQNALFNTVIQLAAMGEEGQDYFFRHGNTLLLLPDLLGFALTGQRRSEYTISSVTQMFDYTSNDWHGEILDAFGINRALLAPVTLPGRVLGPVADAVQAELGTNALHVVNVCAHDTASAVAALPTNDDDVVFISSGTWSLFGVELERPLINQATFRKNFAIEGGVDRRYRLLKNIMGLWLVQECRRSYKLAGQSYSYNELEQLSRGEAAFQRLIDPDDPLFYMPGDMPEKIARKCAQTGQPVPETPGQVIRCIIESLALKYRWALDQIEEITGRKMKAIYILGGGGQDNQLNQFAANACGIPVYAGLTEAALCGNLLMQLRAYGELADLQQARELTARSFAQRVFEPRDTALWNEVYGKFQERFQI